MKNRVVVAGLLLIWLLAGAVCAQSLDDLLLPDAPGEQAAPAGSIEINNDAAGDAAIGNRLLAIYAEFEALDELVVTVNQGIVTVSGPADSAQAAERALALAGQVVGVVEVIDDTRIDADVNQRVESTLAQIQRAMLAGISALPILVLALAVLSSFWWLGRRAGQHRRLFLMIAPNGFIAELLANLLRIAVTVGGLILALSLLDATSIIGSLLGAAGIIGLAVGFAVRDTVENFIASILLSLRSPFLARDYVRIGDHEGTVARLTSRATILISRDGNHVRVPNATVYKSVIVNFSRQPERRFEFRVNVGTDVDLDMARQLSLDVLTDLPGVLPEPAPIVLVEDLAESTVSLLGSAWIDQSVSDLMKVRGEAIYRVKRVFDEQGISMPAPAYRLESGSVEPALRSPSQLVDQASSSDTSSSQPASVVSDLGRPSEGTDRVPSPSSLSDDSRKPEEGTDEAAGSVRDTSADDVMIRQVEQELADPEKRNLLQDSQRQE